MKYILLKENLQKARKILKSINIDESDKNFQAIKELLGNQLGFLGLFTYFFYKKRINIDKLSTLIVNLNDNRNVLKSLPKEVTKYENIEELEDDITDAVEWSIYNKEFVSKLTGTLKGDAKIDAELKDAYTHLSDDVKKDLMLNFIKKVSRYTSYGEFKIDCIHYMNSNVHDIDDVIDRINNTEDAYLCYAENRVVVAEIYSKKTSCELGSKSWCISSNLADTYWERYAGVKTNNKQYFIWNFNVSPTSVDNQVGVTIKKDGTVYTAHLKNDAYVKLESYTQKYNIPIGIFKPIDYTVDLDKIIKAHGFTDVTVKLLDSLDKLNEYKDLMPRKYRLIYGMMTREELLDIPEINRYIYEKGHNYRKEVSELFDMCNSIGDDIEKFVEENPDSKIFDQLNSLNFREKIFLLYKYIVYVDIEDSGLLAYFAKEINEMSSTYPLSVYISDNIWFEFKHMSEDEYSTDILYLTPEEYYGLMNIDSSYGLFDDLRDEFVYMDVYLGQCVDKISEYVEYIKTFIAFPPFLDEIHSLFENAEDEYDKIFRFMSNNIDSRFDDPYEYDSYFSDFWEDIIDDAEVLANSDYDRFINSLVGEYNHGEEMWEINLDDIFSLTQDNYDSELSISDWIQNNPNEIDTTSMHYYDHPYPGDYLQHVDVSSASEKLIEEFQSIISGETENDDLIRHRDIMVYINYLNEKYEPVGIEYYQRTYYRSGKWYGYIGIDDSNKFNILIPYNEIGTNGKANFYKLSISEYGNLLLDSTGKFNDYRDLSGIKGNPHITKIEIDINELMSRTTDPNQLEFKFEKIQTFREYYSNKL